MRQRSKQPASESGQLACLHGGFPNTFGLMAPALAKVQKLPTLGRDSGGASLFLHFAIGLSLLGSCLLSIQTNDRANAMACLTLRLCDLLKQYYAQQWSLLGSCLLCILIPDRAWAMACLTSACATLKLQPLPPYMHIPIRSGFTRLCDVFSSVMQDSGACPQGKR